MNNKYIFPVPDASSLRIDGMSRHFFVRRIFCVGRNYAEHTKEMGGDPRKEAPIFFTKPADAIVQSGAKIPYPLATHELHHEAELVLAIGAEGMCLPVEQASALVWGYAAGNDLTRRDIQAESKAGGKPWDMAKGFDNSAVLGNIHPKSEVNIRDSKITCYVDGDIRQMGLVCEMIWSEAEIISRLSHFVKLMPGDLIFTGTPSGVGPLKAGQTCLVEVEGLSPAEVTIL